MFTTEEDINKLKKKKYYKNKKNKISQIAIKKRKLFTINKIKEKCQKKTLNIFKTI